MSNRLTFAEAEFLLQVLRECRMATEAMRKLTPQDCEAMTEFAGLSNNSPLPAMTTREYREFTEERIEKIDVLIEKVGGLYGL